MSTRILKSFKDTLSQKSPDGVSFVTDQKVVKKVKLLALKCKESFSPVEV